jgi:DNA repair/transcription protein MET18/MMS19
LLETQPGISVAELKLLGPDFVFGVISMIDGERDPRNLLQLFGMLPHFIITFPLGHLKEEMFDVVSCYFPVDFYSVSTKTSSLCVLILQSWL